MTLNSKKKKRDQLNENLLIKKSNL